VSESTAFVRWVVEWGPSSSQHGAGPAHVTAKRAPAKPESKPPPPRYESCPASLSHPDTASRKRAEVGRRALKL